jgi:hypothetical protein
MIFLFEALPESNVRRYFLQVLEQLNLRFPGSHTVPLLNSPWSSPKKFRFRKFWRSYLDQNLLRITNPVSDLIGDQ